ncbi:MAG: glycosyl hydrolase, partial [Burkholderiales bacterium]
RISLDGPRRENAALPQLGKDAVAYIAQNPARRDEIAIATFERDVFVSQDRGKTWKQIAARGQAK